MAQTVDADSAIGSILGQESLSNAQLLNGAMAQLMGVIL
jgi:hypothetical protein